MSHRDRRKVTLVMVVAALLVMALAYSAFSAEGMMSYGSAGSFVGKVISLDHAKKIVTVRSLAGDGKLFTLSDTGQVLKCGKPETWDAIKVGDEVTISYSETAEGNYIVNSVTLSLDMEKCS